MNHHAKRVNIQQSFRAGAPERKEPVDFTFKIMLVAFPPDHTIQWITVMPLNKTSSGIASACALAEGLTHSKLGARSTSARTEKRSLMGWTRLRQDS